MTTEPRRVYLLNCLVPEFTMKCPACSPAYAFLRSCLASCSDGWGEWKGYVSGCAFWSNPMAPSLLVQAISVHHMYSCLDWWGCCFICPAEWGAYVVPLGSMCQTRRAFKFPCGWTGLLCNKCQHKMLVRNSNKTIKNVSIFPHPKPQRNSKLLRE